MPCYSWCVHPTGDPSSLTAAGGTHGDVLLLQGPQHHPSRANPCSRRDFMAGGLSGVEGAQLGEERHLERGEAAAGPAAWVWAPAGAGEA